MSEDDVTTHIDFINYTGGAVDSSWTSADFASLEARLTTFWGAINYLQPTTVKFKECRWYPFGAGITGPNPAVRVTPMGNVAGGVASTPPQQMAMTCGLRTGLRKRWGRLYLPGPAPSAYAAQFIASAYVDAVATSMNALIVGAASNDFAVVVWSPTSSTAYIVEHVHVDNVPDVIRSRRPDKATYSKQLP